MRKVWFFHRGCFKSVEARQKTIQKNSKSGWVFVWAELVHDRAHAVLTDPACKISSFDIAHVRATHGAGGAHFWPSKGRPSCFTLKNSM
jgi:hypothetical protein